MPLIRPSTDADLDAITTIDAHHVLHGTGTFETEPPSASELAKRRANVRAKCLLGQVVENGSDAAHGGKFDRWLDIVFRQSSLGAEDSSARRVGA